MNKVLIADDEAIVREALQTLIDWDGLNCQIVYKASDGIDAWNYLNNNIVDIAILDIKMPGLTGLQIGQLLREENSSISFIFLTAYSEFELVREALRISAADYVTKSNFEIELPKAIIKCIGSMKKKSMPFDPDVNIPQIKKEYSDPVNQIISYIRTHYTERINLNDLSELVHMNDSYICRVYKKQTNFTIFEDITRYRLHQAKMRLKIGDSVKKVSEECGFESPAYFTNVFTKIEGISPKEYRSEYSK